jgi:hypothetical protein
MKIRREVALLVAGSVAVLFGWVLIAYREQIAIAVLGCGYQMAPDPFGNPGACLGTSPGERAVVQIIGMASCVGGAVAVLFGVVNYRNK